MRARNIKPGFFQNADLAVLPVHTRLLFIGLWVLADRAGRLEDRPNQIKFNVCPFDNFDVETSLQELHSASFILRYSFNTAKYIQIVNFLKHQSPHVKEKDSTIPAPDKPGASTRQAPT